MDTCGSDDDNNHSNDDNSNSSSLDESVCARHCAKRLTCFL